MEKLAEKFVVESELHLEHKMEEFDLAKSQLLAQISEGGHCNSGAQCFHRRKQITQIPTGDCQIVNSTAKLLSSLDASTRVSHGKPSTPVSVSALATSANSLPDNRKKTIVERDEEYEKLRQLLTFDEAPKHLQFNPFIRHGYRTFLTTKLCMESIFWWTNETVNIWSHIFGLFLFMGLTIYDINYLNSNASLIDKVMVSTVLVCFQFCMVFSSVYHTFSCRSERHYECFLSFDLLGIALSLLAIYISGIYYAFWCEDFLRRFYTSMVAGIFITAMLMQIPRLNVTSHIKMSVFVCWAAFGILPTLHWAIKMGGLQNRMVALLIPRVGVMYVISGLAFLIYVTRIPERWLTGKVDFVGHSHNWWHIFVLIALYYWHNTGMQFAVYMIDNDCIEDRAKCYT